MSTSPLPQISTDPQPPGSDAASPARTEAAEVQKPEELQGTDQPRPEAQGNDTEPEVTKSRPRACVRLVGGGGAFSAFSFSSLVSSLVWTFLGGGAACCDYSAWLGLFGVGIILLF